MGEPEALLLGIIQGLTEFLPVSSSGHLVIAQQILKKFEEPGLIFDLFLHLGTAAAVILYFRKEMWAAAASIFSKGYRPPEESKWIGNRKTALRFAALIAVGNIPTALIGIFLEDQVAGLFNSVMPVGFALLATSGLLFLSDRKAGNVKTSVMEIRFRDALLIGLFQGLAVMPGLSRSGSAIAAGIFSGIRRDIAAKFSFYMVIPPILGAVTLKARHVMENVVTSQQSLTVYAIGILTAFIIGYLTIGVLIKAVSNKRLKLFAIYCVCIGTAVIALSFAGIL